MTGWYESLCKVNILHRDISTRYILLEEDESDVFPTGLELTGETTRLEASGELGKASHKPFMPIGALDGDPYGFMHGLHCSFVCLPWDSHPPRVFDSHHGVRLP